MGYNMYQREDPYHPLGVSKMRLPTTCHQDGSISYWSVYMQQWRRRVTYISENDFSALSEGERKRIEKHAKKHGWTDAPLYDQGE